MRLYCCLWRMHVSIHRSDICIRHIGTLHIRYIMTVSANTRTHQVNKFTLIIFGHGAVRMALGKICRVYFARNFGPVLKLPAAQLAGGGIEMAAGARTLHQHFPTFDRCTGGWLVSIVGGHVMCLATVEKAQ